MASPHEVLGVPPDADDDEIIDAYRDQVKSAHPDHGGSAREFKRVQRAYRRLRDDAVDAHLTEPAAQEPESAPRTEAANGAARGSRESDTGATRPEGALIEYLDYDALADHGWVLDDENLFEKAADADLDPTTYGHLAVGPHESLLEAAESAGLTWPYACRGGACTNCAVLVYAGEMPTPKSHVLPPSMVERGIRLSCIAAPTSDEAKIVFNVKHLPGVDELRLPPTRFREAMDG